MCGRRANVKVRVSVVRVRGGSGNRRVRKNVTISMFVSNDVYPDVVHGYE